MSTGVTAEVDRGKVGSKIAEHGVKSIRIHFHVQIVDGKTSFMTPIPKTHPSEIICENIGP